MNADRAIAREPGSIPTLGRLGSIRAALADVWPIALSVIPFGMVCGVGAINAGMTVGQALMISITVFAGASQILINEFLSNNTPWPLIVVAALTINLRMLLYSASFAPHFSRIATWKKLILSYLLVDQAFALSIAAWDRRDRPVSKPWYFLGTMLALWPSFQGGNAIGVLMGSALPRSWGLEFSVPLIFLAILVPAIKGRAFALAALVAAVLALVLSGLPYMLGVFIASLAGISTGFIYEEVSSRGR